MVLGKSVSLRMLAYSHRKVHATGMYVVE